MIINKLIFFFALFNVVCCNYIYAIPSDSILEIVDLRRSVTRIWPENGLNKEQNKEISDLFYSISVNQDTMFFVCKNLSILSDKDYFMKSKNDIYKRFEYAKVDFEETIVPACCEIVYGNDTVIYERDIYTPGPYELTAASINDDVSQFSTFRIGEKLDAMFKNMGLYKSLDYFKSFHPNYLIFVHPVYGFWSHNVMQKYKKDTLILNKRYLSVINYILIKVEIGRVKKIFYAATVYSQFQGDLSHYMEYIFF